MKRTRCLFLVSVTLLTLLGACGNDGGRGQPTIDLVPPNPPVGLQIEAQDYLVLISWSDNAEIDLAGYRIYRSSHENGPFRVLNTNVWLCPWYYDRPAPTATTYYRVTAVDESGNESAFSKVVGINTYGHGKTDPVGQLE